MVLVHFEITAKAFANFSPTVGAQRQPWDRGIKGTPETLKESVGKIEIRKKTGNEKSFALLEKLVTGQMSARNFLTISPKVFSDRLEKGFNGQANPSIGFARKVISSRSMRLRRRM